MCYLVKKKRIQFTLNKLVVTINRHKLMLLVAEFTNSVLSVLISTAYLLVFAIYSLLYIHLRIWRKFKPQTKEIFVILLLKSAWTKINFRAPAAFNCFELEITASIISNTFFIQTKLIACVEVLTGIFCHLDVRHARANSNYKRRKGVVWRNRNKTRSKTRRCTMLIAV